MLCSHDTFLLIRPQGTELEYLTENETERLRLGRAVNQLKEKFDRIYPQTTPNSVCPSKFEELKSCYWRSGEKKMNSIKRQLGFVLFRLYELKKSIIG